MRILIVNTDYPAFLQQLYADHAGLADRSYDEQLQVRNASLFGVADFYPRHLCDQGHAAYEVHINNPYLQRAWGAEQGESFSEFAPLGVVLRRGVFPWLRRDDSAWMWKLLAAQIEHYRPDVILSHQLDAGTPRFWKRMRGQYQLLAGQVASAYSNRLALGHFNLMLSSLPNFVARFRKQGLNAELFRLGFDPTVLEHLETPELKYHVSFVGSLSAEHAERIEWLEQICRETEVDVWGLGVETLPADSAIRKAHRGQAWGKAMYRILQCSRISLNHHIGIAGPSANNMRLYEATGVGTMLLTDWKENLGDMFEPGREVATYVSAGECLERIEYFLNHEEARRTIAQAGQKRTLCKHTYAARMRELVAIFQKYLS